MNEMTDLDHAHSLMQSDETDDAARLRYYERLVDTEFFLMLTSEPDGQRIQPELYPVDGKNYALIFDREERLADFSDGIVPYIALSGRAVVSLLADREIGIGVNLGEQASSILIPPNAIDWLFELVSEDTDQLAERPINVSSPTNVPEVLFESLNRKLALATGLANYALLVHSKYASGQSGTLLAVVDTVEGGESAIAQSISEALRFSDVEPGFLDVVFLRSEDTLCAAMEKTGLRFDIPDPQKTETRQTAPGMDPEKPPKLR